ncbi:MAG: carbamoyltransferase HypF [Promethearchaeota archaeon]
MKSRAVVHVTGVVQGVGFRPFLYRLASKWGLTGRIRNKGNFGVELVLDGRKASVESFVDSLRKELPPIAYVEDLDVAWVPLDGPPHPDLRIVRSKGGKGKSLVLPPDVAICDQCAADFNDPSKPRYYQYEFVACAGCGPRFTAVRSLPYDRERTTMDAFPFCKDCQAEYNSPDDRRFHAQTFACKVCGPKYEYRESVNGAPIVEGVVDEAARALEGGKVLAVKGLGGVHLACRADRDDVVGELRRRKRDRKNKPFAVMFPDVATAERFVEISPEERELLESFRRPIVLLRRRSRGTAGGASAGVSELVAPGLDTLGVLLPYMGLHLGLFARLGDLALVFTSGNVTGLPMATRNDDILGQLAHLADAFLLHDREVFQRCDDSVARVVRGRPKLIRRSRGYVPEYVPLPFDAPGSALAVGPELHSTGAALKANRVFPTQHVGNVTNLETYEFLEGALLHLKSLLGIDDDEVAFVAKDQHPLFHSSKLGEELAGRFGSQVVGVYHHHAHAAALMADRGVPLDEECVVLALDGVGYGADGNAWGGEVLATTYSEHVRVGFLEYLPMVGGDACARFPGKMLASVLFAAVGVDEARDLFEAMGWWDLLPRGRTEFEATAAAYASGNYPVTSSTGRVLDAVAAALGVCDEATYDGEPAMRLEALANRAGRTWPSGDERWQLPLETGSGATKVRTRALFEALAERGASPRLPLPERAVLARGAVVAVAGALASVGVEQALGRGCRRLGMTGGVAYNLLFNQVVAKAAESSGLEYLEHDRVPCGDAGVSVGQLAVACAQRRENL